MVLSGGPRCIKSFDYANIRRANTCNELMGDLLITLKKIHCRRFAMLVRRQSSHEYLQGDRTFCCALVSRCSAGRLDCGDEHPARLDRLRWGRFHTLVVVALGITWILDGLEVTLAGAVSPALKESPRLRFSNADVGLVSSSYVAGAVLGAMFFGWLTDRLGRKRLFFMTLAVYLVATAATAFSWNLWSFALFRFFTGAGIGGEYAAINSAIQELVPARYRGWTDLVINGSFWVGAAIGAAGSILLLDPAVLHRIWAGASLF